MSNVVGGKRRQEEPEDTQAGGEVGGMLSRAFGKQQEARSAEQTAADNNARAAQSATAKSNELRSSGQAVGTVETGQSDGPGPLPDESRSSQGGDTGQNIAPTKKRGAYRAAVGGANSIRI